MRSRFVTHAQNGIVMQTKVASIIVTFNPDIQLLERQLRSISKFTHVILVDNFSFNVEDILLVCKRVSSEIKYLKLDENMGLAFAQNTGIKEAKLNGCSHVILFDQDSYLSAESYENLLSIEKSLINQGFKIGAVGPVCVDPVSTNSYPITEYRGPFIVRKYLGDVEVCQASFIVASGSLIRMDVINTVGMMRDELFIDYIDVEWCYRAQSLGYKLFVTSDSRLEHIIGDSRVKFFGRSISMHSATRRYYLTRNCLRMLTLSHIPLGYKVREIVLLFARILAFMYLSDERKRYCNLMIRALYDALRGKYGKLEESS